MICWNMDMVEGWNSVTMAINFGGYLFNQRSRSITSYMYCTIELDLSIFYIYVSRFEKRFNFVQLIDLE